MAYDHIIIPANGQKITIAGSKLSVPDNPIIGFIEGDGTGPDITAATQRIINAAVQAAYQGKRSLAWMQIYAGEKAAQLYHGEYLPAETLDALREFIIGLKGPLTTPVGEGFRSLNVAIRQELDLYACIRPVRWYEGVPSPVVKPQDVDVVIFRENTEDVYAGIEYEAGTEAWQKVNSLLREELGAKMWEGANIGIKPISPFASKRLVRKAIRYALDEGRKSVTLVHKGNIQKFTEGGFRKWGYEVAREEFPEYTITEEELFNQYGGTAPQGKIVIKDRIADIIFQLMLLRPKEFDILATTNLNGDYLSDAIAAQVGGLGIAPGANIGEFIGVFEATHGTAPKYANLDKVNPGSLLFSGVMMLQYIGWREAAELIVKAYEKTVQQKIVTYDFARLMSGAKEVRTSEFAGAVIANM